MISRIFVDKTAVSETLTRRVLKNCGDIPVDVVPNRRPVDEWIAAAEDPVGEGKKTLWLTRKKGGFVKPCPCTPMYIGCNYFIINSVLNCPLDCSYCILQIYLGPSPVTVFVNLEDMRKEWAGFIRRRPGRFLRIGTGELADSLALDPLTRTAGGFIAYFKTKSRAFFELKTKTVNIQGVLKAEPAENIVVSWSLNAVEIARREERGAPSVSERIEAAREVVGRGFFVGFHFDPLVIHPGWEEAYGRVIERLLRTIPPKRIRWISLGCLRFSPALKGVIEDRFPRSRVVLGEMIPGRDGKLRYFKPLRLELYRRIVGLIRENGGERIPLYFCMEDGEVWKKVLKKNPGRKDDVELALSPRVKGLRPNLRVY
jgi:spore photoproduct lyase